MAFRLRRTRSNRGSRRFGMERLESRLALSADVGAEIGLAETEPPRIEDGESQDIGEEAFTGVIDDDVPIDHGANPDDGVIYTLSGDGNASHCHNAEMPWDVDANGQVTVEDLVRIAEALRDNGGAYELVNAAGEDASSEYLDVTGDNRVSVSDLVATASKLRDGAVTAQSSGTSLAADEALMPIVEDNGGDSISDTEDSMFDSTLPADSGGLGLWAGDEGDGSPDDAQLADAQLVDDWAADDAWQDGAWDDVLEVISEDLTAS